MYNVAGSIAIYLIRLLLHSCLLGQNVGSHFSSGCTFASLNEYV